MSSDFDDDHGNIRPRRPERPPQGRPQPRRDDDHDLPPPGPSGSGAKTVLIILAVVALAGCICIGAPLGFLGYFGYTRMTQTRDKVHAANNYKQIALGFHNYASRYDTFPPEYLKTRDGKPGLSWRVAVLPYIDQESLYKQFKLDEPWDSPTNRSLAAKMPAVYASERGAGGELTHVRIFVGPMSVYDPKRGRAPRFTDITDGTGNTVLFVEAEQPVVWTKPDELPFDPKGKLPALGLPDHDYFLVAFCDGAVRPIKKTANLENFKKAITATGGEMLDPSFP